MTGASIEYIYAEPYACSPIVAIGTVIAFQQHHGVLHLHVQPDDPNRLTKWRTEHHLIRYVHDRPAVAAALVA